MATDPITDDEILDALEKATRIAPVATAGDVAEHVDVGQRTVLNYLNALENAGKIRKKSVGARSAIWWVDPIDERITDAIAAFEVPGEGDLADARRDALRRAVEYIRVHGEAKKSEVSRAVFDESVGYKTPESLYKNCLLNGLNAVADELDELTPSTPSAPWRFE